MSSLAQKSKDEVLKQTKEYAQKTGVEGEDTGGMKGKIMNKMGEMKDKILGKSEEVKDKIHIGGKEI